MSLKTKYQLQNASPRLPAYYSISYRQAQNGFDRNTLYKRSKALIQSSSNQQMRVIHFHLKTGEYGWLSNFAPYPITIQDETWPTVEHFYQGSKFPHDPEWQRAIRSNARPYDAWRMARHPDHAVRSDWEQVKDEIMYQAVLAKFTQHEQLRKLLQETGDATLIEHSPNDPYWGDGGNGQGQNKLGQILMQIRSDLGA